MKNPGLDRPLLESLDSICRPAAEKAQGVAEFVVNNQVINNVVDYVGRPAAIVTPLLLSLLWAAKDPVYREQWFTRLWSGL